MIETVPVGEHAVRFAIPKDAPRAALLAWLLDLPRVTDASLAAEHALVVFEGAPEAFTLPAFIDVVSAAPTEHVIEVTYDGADLEDVARATGLVREEIVRRHTSHVLEVAFLGFCPGFAYLVGLDPILASLARRGDPRPRVPAGSVAIAGGYGGIYPASTPGGWQLLGTARDARLIDGEVPRLAAGDRVRFVAAEVRASIRSRGSPA